MNEVDVIFADTVRRLRELPSRYRHYALFAAEFWDDERIAQGVGPVDDLLFDNAKPARPSLRLVRGD